jgi:hypothetical protein
MKDKKIIVKSLLVFLLCLGSFTMYTLNAQESDADNYRTLFYFTTTKNADQTRVLKVEFLARNKENRKDKVAVPAAPIQFYNILEDEEVLLGESSTNKQGIAELALSADQKYLADEEGYITFLALFEGTDALDEEEEELMIKDLHLGLKLMDDEGERSALVTAYTLDSIGEEVPVEELNIIVGVESLLSLMPLTEDYLEEGEYEMEIPGDIPGDHDGNLVFKVKVDESDDYGTVFASQTIDWGLRKETSQVQKNQLWTTAAPMWMYIVLTILLLGVWANFAYTVVNLRKIKKMGKN